MNEPEFQFGTGRISGVLSVALGGSSLLAVLCFQFPELLTTPDLRSAYPVPLLRIDHVFGTAYTPDRWPSEYGIAENPVPEGWFAQLVHPLRGIDPNRQPRSGSR